jgi:hypothetical protein
MILTLVAFILIVLFFTLGVFVFDESASIYVAWAITLVSWIRLIHFGWDRVRSSRTEEFQKRFPNFNSANFIAQVVIFTLLIPVVIHLLMGTNFGLEFEDERLNITNSLFSIAMILIAISGSLGIFELRRVELDDKGRTISVDYDFDKTSMFRLVGMILASIIGLIIFPTFKSTIVGNFVGSIGGQITGGEWFNRIYFEILTSPYTQFTLVMILISSLSILIGKARGIQGSAQMVIGALGVAGVPMMIVIFIFAGAVPAPEAFSELFAVGFAELVFAISFTALIGLILSLVGVFYELVPSAVTGALDD